MNRAVGDPSQFIVTPFGRRRRRGTFSVIATVAVLAFMSAVRAFRRAVGWQNRS